MYTYFTMAREDEIVGMKTISDVLVHLEKTVPMLGGYVGLDAISSLSNVFLHNGPKPPKQTNHSLADGSRFYLLDREVCQRIASSEHEELLDASVPWDEESWQGTNVNRMDLAGFLLDLSALCKQANTQNTSVYVLLSKED